MEVKQIGNVMPTKKRENPNQGRVYDCKELAPCIVDYSAGGNRQPMIVGEHKASNTLTSVQKDNLVMERADVVIGGLQEHQTPRTDGISPTLTSAMGMGGGQTPLISETVRIRQATEQGYAECKIGGVADLLYPTSKTRRGRVQDNGDVCPAITAMENGLHRIESVYRIRKLTEKECWRLMNFKDDDFNKTAQVNSPSQLYKQSGNSIVRNCLVAIIGQMIEGKENVYKEI